MFNTIGNLVADARCGVMLIDFQHARIYQMTGDTKLYFDQPDASEAQTYAGRSRNFHVQSWRSTELPVEVDWEFIDFSPYNPRS